MATVGLLEQSHMWFCARAQTANARDENVPEIMLERRADGSYYKALNAADNDDHEPLQEMMLDCLIEQ